MNPETHTLIPQIPRYEAMSGPKDGKYIIGLGPLTRIGANAGSEKPVIIGGQDLTVSPFSAPSPLMLLEILIGTWSVCSGTSRSWTTDDIL